MTECYICLEEGQTFKTCDCNLHIHKACFEKMACAQLKSTNALTCSVCKSQYEHKVKSRASMLVFNIIMFAFSAISLIQFAQSIFTFVIFHNDSYRSNILVLNVCVSAAALTGMLVLHIKYKEQTGSYQWCILSRYIKSVEIKTKEIDSCLTFPDHKCVSSNNMNVYVRIPCLKT